MDEAAFEAIGGALRTQGFALEQLGGGLLGWGRTGTTGYVLVTDDGDTLIVGFYPGNAWEQGDTDSAVYDLIPIPADTDATVARILAFSAAQGA